MKIEQAECSETSEYKIQTPGITQKKHTTFRTRWKFEIKNMISFQFRSVGHSRQAQLHSKVTPFYRVVFCKLGAKERNIKANELHVCTPADKLVCHCELLCSAVLLTRRAQCRLSNQFSFIAQEANSKQLTRYISQKTRACNPQLS
jgi:hypothetical protein